MPPEIVKIHELAVKAVRDHFASSPEGCFRLLAKGEIPDQQADPQNIIGWETKISNGQQWVDIKIVLTSQFPYRLPRIYLAQPTPHPIPHLTPSRENHICTYERHSTFIDISRPIELVIETIIKAAKIITDGLSQVNVNEFDLEFQRYWLLGKDKRSCLSLLVPRSEAKQVDFITFEPPIGGFSTLVSGDSPNDGAKWLENLNRKITNVVKGIFLPLTKPLRPPFPNKNHEIYKCFKSSLSPTNFSKLNNFIRSTTKSVLPVIFYFTKRFARVSRTEISLQTSKCYLALVIMRSKKQMQLVSIALAYNLE
ncbi:MAG: E2/UBC family protein [Deltaproteobacteria bacterium]